MSAPMSFQPVLLWTDALLFVLIVGPTPFIASMMTNTVGEYLDQTREVFGDALRFQRELFSELRALRSGAPT